MMNTAGSTSERDNRTNGPAASNSMREPMVMAITPPMARTPCEMIFTSRMKRMMARMMRRMPA